MSDEITRPQLHRWLKRQPTVELVPTNEGLAAVDLVHGWAVLVLSAHGAGPSVDVLLADLSKRIDLPRWLLIDTVEHNDTIRQAMHRSEAYPKGLRREAR